MNSNWSAQLPALSNTPDFVARFLRQAIIRGEIKSNEPLRQDKLASQLGVSKIPVREALVQLKAEGLITYKSNRGAFVRPLSANEAREIYLMRIALETIALEHAIPKLKKQDIALAHIALMEIASEMDSAKWGELNWAFHAVIYQLADMPLLLATIEMLHANVSRYLTLYLNKLAFHTQSQAEHYALLEACEQGDLDKALAVLQEHLLDASAALVAYLSHESGAYDGTI